jgi:hypothetical protein
VPLRDDAARFTRELSLASAAVLLLGLGAAGHVAPPAQRAAVTLAAAEQVPQGPRALW